MIPRDVMQTIITKLDLKAATPSEAKAFVAKGYGVKITGRTREDVIRAVIRNAERSA